MAQGVGPFILVGMLAGTAPVLWRGVPDHPDPELQVWTFVGQVVGGSVIGAIAGAVVLLVMTRLLNSRDSPAARLRRYHSGGES